MKKLLLLSFIFLTNVVPADALSLRQLSLDEMVDYAHVAFHGTCTANRIERDPLTKMVVTYTTFQVLEPLKGKVLATHVIKQIGGRLPNGEGATIIDGVPSFVIGQEYVVLLAGISPVGFSSPVGLSQGRFSVEVTSAGKRVSNGRSFSKMAKPAASSTTAALAGPPKTEFSTAETADTHLGLEAFKNTVRVRAGRLGSTQ